MRVRVRVRGRGSLGITWVGSVLRLRDGVRDGRRGKGKGRGRGRVRVGLAVRISPGLPARR